VQGGVGGAGRGPAQVPIDAEPLHDSRHTTLTLMEHAGVPISIVSKWAGHYDAAFTQRTYVHASDDDLEQGRRAIARIHKIA
jgi:integrase